MVEIISEGLVKARIIKIKTKKGYDCYKIVYLDDNDNKLFDYFINYKEVEHYEKRIK